MTAYASLRTCRRGTPIHERRFRRLYRPRAVPDTDGVPEVPKRNAATLLLPQEVRALVDEGMGCIDTTVYKSLLPVTPGMDQFTVRCVQSVQIMV